MSDNFPLTGWVRGYGAQLVHYYRGGSHAMCGKEAPTEVATELTERKKGVIQSRKPCPRCWKLRA